MGVLIMLELIDIYLASYSRRLALRVKENTDLASIKQAASLRGSAFER